MPEILQEIGAAAGLASVVGLAVLSVLYFSQARDVKRLREWAGRAPERAAETAAPAVPGRAQPVPQPAQGQATGAPPGAAKPAQPVPQPAATQAAGAAKPGQPAPAGAPKPGQPVPQPVAAAGSGAAQPGQPASAAAQAAAGQALGAKPGQPADAPQPAGAQAEGGAQPHAVAPEGAAAAGAAAAGGAATGMSAAVGAEGGKADDEASKTAAAEQGQPAEAEPSEAESDRAEAEETDTREGVAVAAGQGPGPARAAVAAATGAGAAAAVQAKAAPATRPIDAPAASPGDGGKAGGPPSAPGGAGAPATSTPPSVPSGPGGPATPAGGRAPAAPPPVPAAQRAPVRRVLPPRPMPQQTAIIPPSRQPWYRRLLATPRYLVLVVAGVLILGGAAVFGISQLSSGDDTGAPAADTGASNPQPANDGGGGEQPKETRRAVVPGNVTVAVLNGTTVPGLAKQVGDQVESHGFRLGTVANATDQDQQRAESVVLFSPGHRSEARAVGRRLRISQFQPVDPASQELAGDATVVVIAGANLAQ